MAHQDHSPAKPGRSLWDMCEAFMQHTKARKEAYAGDTRLLLRSHVMSTPIAGLPAHVVAPEHVSALLRQVAERHGMETASSVRSRLHAAYEFALTTRGSGDHRDANGRPYAFAAFEELGTNPVWAVATVRAANPFRPCPALSETELGHVLRSLQEGTSGHPAHALGCRIVLFNLGLAMQRGAPLLQMRLDHIERPDVGSVTLRLTSRRKGARHVVPVCGSALAQLMWFEQRSHLLESPWLFAHPHFSQPLKQEIMYRALHLIRRDLVQRQLLLSELSVFSLRRTTEELLQINGVHSLVINKLQDRVDDSPSRFVVIPDLRGALLHWQDWLSRLQQAQGVSHTPWRLQTETK